MKLLNRSLLHLAIVLFPLLGLWATVFYFNMMDEVHDSIDDGLANYKLLIIQRMENDSTVQLHTAFNESNYALREVSRTQAAAMRDTYRDTMMYMQFEDDLEPVRMLTTAFVSQGRYYELRVISSMVEEDDLMSDLFWALVWLYLLLLLAIILVNNVLLRKIWGPFHQILTQLKTYRLGDGNALAQVRTDITEFNELKTTTAALLHHASEAFNGQRSFTENAAHELQTPLAIAINKLELLAEQDSPQPEALAQVLDLLQRLTRINRSLLLLSRIENRQFGSTGQVPLHQLCQQLMEELGQFAYFKEVTFTYTEHDTPTLQMNAELATVLVSNLLKNAIVHNYAQGQVHVMLEQTQLTISNSGPDQALDATRIFHRFHKEGDSTGGSGLGLAIAKAITDLHGMGLHYNHDTMHRFTIRFRKNL